MKVSRHLHRIPSWIPLAVLLLAATAAAYAPGLSGGFLFDDEFNLRAIGALGPVDNWRTLILYLTSGTADPTGRPVAMLSFLIDAHDWPAPALPFKRTNLILHLINGCLLFAVVRMMQVRTGIGASAKAAAASRIALLAAGLWLVHPLFVSTTLYVVQRHAMLPMTFTLAALLVWLHGWRSLQSNPSLVRMLAVVAGVWAFTILAGLSKANGFLAPVMLLLVHWITCSRHSGGVVQVRTPHARIAFWIALVLPAVIVVFALLAYVPTDLAWKPHHRDWTVGERLLTQPRVMFDYLRLLVLPRIHSGGLYVEGFEVSRAWTQPLTTLPAALGIIVLVASAVLVRRRLPALSIAVLTFFVAHSVEASTIPLELYFEHRNYLPAVFLFWPLAQFLLAPRADLRAVRGGLAILLPCLLLLMTWQRATVWGDPLLQAAIWGQGNESSVRAQITAATALASAGHRDEAVARLRSLAAQHPESVEIAMNRIAIECPTDRLSESTLAAAAATLSDLRTWRFTYYSWLERMVYQAGQAGCPAATEQDLDRLIAAADRSPGVASNDIRKQNWLHVLGLRELRSGMPDGALARFDEAIRVDPDPERALVHAAALGNWGWPGHGVQHLDRYLAIAEARPARLRANMRSLHRKLRDWIGYYDVELRVLRSKLSEAAHGASKHPVTDNVKSGRSEAIVE